ncbi:MAG: ABC transporter permease, partial [Mycobacterium sp.]|nr:ABC transporter permease [Mycobacterium sp.]
KPTRGRGPVRAFFHALLRSKTGFVGFWVFLFLCLMGLFGQYFVSPDRNANVNQIYQFPSSAHWLGTDFEGKDTLKQILAGGQDVIVVGLVAASVSTIIAVVFGSLAAYLGGGFDSTVVQVTDFVLTIPQFPLLLVLSAYLQLDSAILLAFLLGALGWPTLLRAVRAQVLSLKEREYVEAARLVDLGTTRIILREIMPNMASYILINFITAMTGAVYALAGLYLLGLAPMSGTNWGIMINEAWTKGAIFNTDSAFFLLSPLIVISLLQVSSIWLMRSLEEMINPRLREA